MVHVYAREKTSPLPCLIVDPRPGLYIVDINDAYSAAAMTNRSRISGERLFTVFPDNPEVSEANSVANVYGALRTVAETGKPQALSGQRYDIRDAGGQFVERYWQARYEPIFDEGGDLAHLLVHAIDVTADLLSSHPSAT